MRFVHMADVHLGCIPDGKTEWGEKRSRELWETFQSSLQDAGERKADLVLIAGDLFHTPPDERRLREVSYLFSSFPHMCFALIAGNHDYVSGESAWRTFHFPGNVALLGAEGCECITFGHIGTEVYGFSYNKPQIDRRLYDGLKPEDNDFFHILLAHGGDAQHIPYSPQEMSLSGFDYIALGHIHKPQILLKNRAAYSGALSPIDAGDEGPHGYIVGETAGHSVSLKFVPKARREYVTMTVSVTEGDTTFSLRDTVARAIGQKGPENIYKIVLKGQRAPGVRFDTDLIGSAGLILSVDDQTSAAVHLDELRQRYHGQLIGRYIESFERKNLTEVEQKALQVGLEALLAGENRK